MDWLNTTTGPLIILGWMIVVGLILAFVERKDRKKDQGDK